MNTETDSAPASKSIFPPSVDRLLKARAALTYADAHLEIRQRALAESKGCTDAEREIIRAEAAEAFNAWGAAMRELNAAKAARRAECDS